MRRAAPPALLTATLITAIVACGCGPQLPRVTLPVGPCAPAAVYAAAFAGATTSCRAVRSLTTNLALSGSAGRQKLGGHVLAGFAADALRLEGVAPFGGPLFILAAESGRGTLFLPRERHVVQAAAPAEILEALVGVRLSPDDLLAVLTGCVKSEATPSFGRRYGTDWLAVELNGGATAYLRHVNGEWDVTAGVLEGLQVDYGRRVGGLPAMVGIRTSDPRRTPRVDLEVRLQSPEINAPIDRAAFGVTVPPGTSAITVQELRESYHR